MKLPRLLVPLFAALLLCNCVSTVETRIEDNPARFEALSAEHKRLAERGEIAEGMNQDAVYLAWGRPASVSKGGSGGKRIESWRYTGQEAVFVDSVGFGYGRGCRGYGYWDGGSTIYYIPYTRAKVQFENDRVTRWEQLR